jgi:Cu(I)/Ag(I) efflux system membrane fusion protein
MSDALITQVERSERTKGTITITSPISGVIQTLDARAGVAMSAGQTLAQVSGIDTVWLNAAVPQAQASAVRVGQHASVSLSAFRAALWRPHHSHSADCPSRAGL